MRTGQWAHEQQTGFLQVTQTGWVVWESLLCP